MPPQALDRSIRRCGRGPLTLPLRGGPLPRWGDGEKRKRTHHPTSRWVAIQGRGRSPGASREGEERVVGGFDITFRNRWSNESGILRSIKRGPVIASEGSRCWSAATPSGVT